MRISDPRFNFGEERGREKKRERKRRKEKGKEEKREKKGKRKGKVWEGRKNKRKLFTVTLHL